MKNAHQCFFLISHFLPATEIPVADMDLSQAALIVEDVPLRYRPPVGPEISIRLMYHQRTA